ncbi:MAG TPA: hypothetical protein VGL00_01695 [Terracidiphilus sp.]
MSPLAKKKDPSITFLNKFGYNVIRLPRTGIEPLDVIGRDQSMQWLGPLSKVWTSASPEPLPGPPHPAAAVNGQRTDALELSLGLGILANTLAAFGASAPLLNTAFKNAHAVQFTYTNVTSTSISPFEAGNYLASGTLRTENPVVKNYFGSERAKAYLIVEVLKANSITVTATDSHGTEIGLNLPQIEGVVDAKIGVKPSDSSNSTVTFTGPVPVTFGFVVQQIGREGDSWVLHGAAPSADISFGGPGFGRGPQASAAASPMVFDTGELDCRLDM